MAELLCNKIRYLLGEGVSSFGDGLQQIASSWLVYELTGKAASVGFMIAINYIPSIFLGPFASVYLDQKDSKKWTAGIDVARGLVVILAAILFWSHIKSVWVFYVMQTILAICYALYKPTSQTLIREAFVEREIPFVISKSNSVTEATSIAGSGLAGLIVSFAPTLCLLLNAVSFVVSAGFTLSLKITSDTRQKQNKIKMVSGIKEGVQFVKNREGMLYLLVLSVTSSAFNQMTAVSMIPYAKALGGGSALYSLFDILFTIGSIAAGLVLEKLFSLWGNKVLAMTSILMPALSFIAAINRSLPPALFLFLSLGFFIILHMTAMQTLVQLYTPKEMTGRITGLRQVIASISKAGSGLASGLLIGDMGVGGAFSIFGVLGALFLLTFRKMKDVWVPDAMKKA